MQDTIIAGFPDVWGGRSRAVPDDHKGPASYTVGGETFPAQSVYGGPNSLGLAGVLWCSGGPTESGNYIVVPVFGGGGKVAGTIKLKWLNAGGGGGASGSGVANVTITAGGTYTGTTPTVTFGAAPAGGTTATGVAVLNGAGTAVIGVLITNPGAGYLTAPTVTFGAGGATGTANLAAGGEVAATTNLSAEVIRLLLIGG